ncbi:MAG: hypothetical protein L0H64_24370, partial [Pseudonocardia sp.]|nr:hypothetical protein [Pseudonocardia sp.]
MTGYYRTTGVPFEQMTLADIRDPILTGPGHSAMEAVVANYRNLAESLQTIGRDVRAALDVAMTAHEGAAADATQAHLSTLQSPGETGWAQAKLAALAVEDQATYHVRARNDVQALPDATLFEDMLGVLSPENGRRQDAVAAANLYQGNSNHNLGAGFQAFEPPEDRSVSLAPAATAFGGAGEGVGALNGGSALGAAPGSVTPALAPTTAPTGSGLGGSATTPGAIGPVSPGGGGTAPSTPAAPPA